jgi:hypothetical protein
VRWEGSICDISSFASNVDRHSTRNIWAKEGRQHKGEKTAEGAVRVYEGCIKHRKAREKVAEENERRQRQ